MQAKRNGGGNPCSWGWGGRREALWRGGTEELEHQKCEEKQKAAEAAKKVAAKKVGESTKGKGKAKDVEDSEPELKKKKSKWIVETDEEGDGPEMPLKKKVKAEESGGSMMDAPVPCLRYVYSFLKLFKLLTFFQMQEQ